jgi:hypothetical protein
MSYLCLILGETAWPLREGPEACSRGCVRGAHVDSLAAPPCSRNSCLALSFFEAPGVWRPDLRSRILRSRALSAAARSHMDAHCTPTIEIHSAKARGPLGQYVLYAL